MAGGPHEVTDEGKGTNPNKSQNGIVTRIENVIELRPSLPVVCRAKARGFEGHFSQFCDCLGDGQILARFRDKALAP